jgi:uncharacterized protein (TIGR02271 family)
MSDGDDQQRLALVEEEARISKQDVVTGKVTVRTVSEDFQQIVREHLDQEKIEVTRVPVNREVDKTPAMRTVDGVLIVPVMEERLVIEKRLVLAEELHIRTQVIRQEVEAPVTLRKQRADIVRDSASPETSGPSKKETMT